MNSTARSDDGFDYSKERFIVLNGPLPPTMNFAAAYSKAMTRSQQRFYVYADHDRLIGEGIRLVTDHLIKALGVLEDHNLSSRLDADSQEKKWQKHILSVFRRMKQWEKTKLKTQTFSKEFEKLTDYLNEKTRARNLSANATELSRYRDRHSKDRMKQRESIQQHTRGQLNVGSKAFKVAVSHAGSPKLIGSISDYNL